MTSATPSTRPKKPTTTSGGRRKPQIAAGGPATVTRTRCATRCCCTSVSLDRYDETAFDPSRLTISIRVRFESPAMRADVTSFASIVCSSSVYPIVCFACAAAFGGATFPGPATALGTPRASTATRTGSHLSARDILRVIGSRAALLDGLAQVRDTDLLSHQTPEA